MTPSGKLVAVVSAGLTPGGGADFASASGVELVRRAQAACTNKGLEIWDLR